MQSQQQLHDCGAQNKNTGKTSKKKHKVYNFHHGFPKATHAKMFFPRDVAYDMA